MFASAMLCTYASSRWSICTRTLRLSLRADAVPNARVSAAVWATARSSIAAATVASVGVGFGKNAFPVIACTTPRAMAMRTTTLARGSLSDVMAP